MAEPGMDRPHALPCVEVGTVTGDPREPDSITFTVTPIDHQLVVSRELLEQHTMPQVSFDLMSYLNPTPEQRAEQEQRRRKYEAERAERFLAAKRRHRRAIALLDLGGALAERLLDVLDLHDPTECGSCSTCEDDEQSVEWPCDTWLAAAGEEAAS